MVTEGVSSSDTLVKVAMVGIIDLRVPGFEVGNRSLIYVWI